VQQSGAAEVGLTAAGPVRISVPKGTEPEVSLALRYEGPLQAPIAKGEEVAELIVSIEGMPDHRVPLVASEEVLEATMLQRVFNAMRSWVA
jgi:D-alanyl-D-alanine carboxypeptidase (penicillin-binding protein 5/6)